MIQVRDYEGTLAYVSAIFRADDERVNIGSKRDTLQTHAVISRPGVESGITPDISVEIESNSSVVATKNIPTNVSSTEYR